MTVRQLKKALAKFPDDYQVTFCEHDHDPVWEPESTQYISTVEIISETVGDLRNVVVLHG